MKSILSFAFKVIALKKKKKYNLSTSKLFTLKAHRYDIKISEEILLYIVENIQD